MFAAERGRKELIQILIEAKANVNLQMKQGQTALMFATEQGHAALIFATEQGHLYVITELLEAKANPEAQNEIKLVAGGRVHGTAENRVEISDFMKKVENNHKYEMVDMSYFHLPTMFSYNEEKRRKAHESFNVTMSEDMKVEEIEVKKAVVPLLPKEVHFEDMYKQIPLMFCATFKYPKFVKFRLDNGADINTIDENGMTALFWASLVEDNEMMKILLEAKTSVNITDWLGRTVLHHAI